MSRNMEYLCGNHVPVICKCFENSDGPILEMGTGLYSTPVFDMMCNLRQKRHITSLEGHPKWYDLASQNYQSDYHDVIKIDNDDYDSIPIEDTLWGIAFIDHKPKLRRRVDIERLAWRAYYVVVHDTQPEREKDFQFEEVFKLFKYREDFKECDPNTTVLSNYSDLKEIRWRR